MVRLRVSQVVIQPHLVWDNGDELAPGPNVDPIALPVSGIAAFIAGLPAELRRLELELQEQQQQNGGRDQ